MKRFGRYRSVQRLVSTDAALLLFGLFSLSAARAPFVLHGLRRAISISADASWSWFSAGSRVGFSLLLRHSLVVLDFARELAVRPFEHAGRQPLQSGTFLFLHRQLEESTGRPVEFKCSL